MVESTTGTGEAGAERSAGLRMRLFVAFDGLKEDTVEAADIDEVIVEGAGAGGIEPWCRVLLAQREELLALA